MKRSRIIGIILASLLVVNVFAGCGKKKQAEVAQPLTPVEAYKVSKGKIQVIHKVSGQVKAASEVQIFPKAPGKVLSVRKEIGDKVGVGDILFSLDREDLQRQLESARAQAQNSNVAYQMAADGYGRTKKDGSSREQQLNQNKAGVTQSESGLIQAKARLEQAETRQKNAQTDVGNNKPLFDSGAISKQQMDNYDRELTNANIEIANAKTALAAAQESYDNATASYKLLEDKLLAEGEVDAKYRVDQASAGVASSAVSIKNIQASIADSDVKATISGIIASKGIEAGGYASAQSPSYTIVDVDSVNIEAEVTEQVINKVTKNQEVIVTIKALNGKQFKGAIDSYSPAITGQSIGYPVKITIENKDHVIKPGMFAEVEFAIEEKNDVIKVPMESVLNEKGKTVVYILDGDVAKKKEVKVGLKDGKDYEVIEGVNENEKILIKGQQFVKDGEKVQLVGGGQ